MEFYFKRFLGSDLTAITCPCLSLSTGGVITYISSGSASSPESCMSSSPSSGYLSTSPTPPRPSLPSRAVGMVVDICPPAKSGHHRSHGMEKAGRSSTSAKSSITSKHNIILCYCEKSCVSDLVHTHHCFSLFLQKSMAWCCCARCAVMWPLASIMAFMLVRAAR